MVSFAVRKLLIRSHFKIFVFAFITLGDRSKKILLQLTPYTLKMDKDLNVRMNTIELLEEKCSYRFLKDIF